MSRRAGGFCAQILDTSSARLGQNFGFIRLEPMASTSKRVINMLASMVDSGNSDGGLLDLLIDFPLVYEEGGADAVFC